MNAPGSTPLRFRGDTLQVPVDPGIAAVLKRYPLPNDSTGSFGAHTYATPSSVTTNADQFSLRLDHTFSAKDQLFARFNIDNLTGPTTNPDQTAIDPSFAITYIDRQRNVVGTWTAQRLVRASFSCLPSASPAPRPDFLQPIAPTPRSSSATASSSRSTRRPVKSCRPTAIYSRAASSSASRRPPLFQGWS